MWPIVDVSCMAGSLGRRNKKGKRIIALASSAKAATYGIGLVTSGGGDKVYLQLGDQWEYSS